MATAAHPLHRSDHPKTVQVHLQRPALARPTDRIAVSQAMEDRAAVQVDEAASAHQRLFRHHAQRSEEPVVDRGDRSAPDSSPKAPAFPEADSQRNCANSERDTLRENPYK